MLIEFFQYFEKMERLFFGEPCFTPLEQLSIRTKRLGENSAGPVCCLRMWLGLARWLTLPGNVIHVVGSEKAKSQRSRIPNLKGDKEVVRQCYLFTNHMLLCNRTSAGKLHLVEVSVVFGFYFRVLPLLS